MAGMLERKPLDATQRTQLNQIIKAGGGTVPWGSIPDEHFEWVFGVSKWIYLDSHKPGSRNPRGGAHVDMKASQIDSVDAYIQAYKAVSDKRQALEKAKLIYFGRPRTVVAGGVEAVRKGSDAVVGAVAGAFTPGRRPSEAKPAPAAAPASPPSPRGKVVAESTPFAMAHALMEAATRPDRESMTPEARGILSDMRARLIAWGESQAQKAAASGTKAERSGVDPATRARVDALRKAKGDTVTGAAVTHAKVEGNEAFYRGLYRRAAPTVPTKKRDDVLILGEIIKRITGKEVKQEGLVWLCEDISKPEYRGGASGVFALHGKEGNPVTHLGVLGAQVTTQGPARAMLAKQAAERAADPRGASPAGKPVPPPPPTVRERAEMRTAAGSGASQVRNKDGKLAPEPPPRPAEKAVKGPKGEAGTGGKSRSGSPGQKRG